MRIDQNSLFVSKILKLKYIKFLNDNSENRMKRFLSIFSQFCLVIRFLL